MATASRAVRTTGPKEDLYTWEGKDKTGKVVRGEIRAAGDAMVQAMLRRQGVQVRGEAAGGQVGERLGQRCLPQAGSVFNQQVAAGQQAGQGQVAPTAGQVLEAAGGAGLIDLQPASLHHPRNPSQACPSPSRSRCAAPLPWRLPPAAGHAI